MPKIKTPTTTKKATVHAMLEKGSVSVADIMQELTISKQAAYSLISDVKRSGVAVSGVLKNGAMHYSAVSPRAPRKRTKFGAKQAQPIAEATA